MKAKSLLLLLCLSVLAHSTSITLDGSAVSWTYDGHGALSAGASSRLLIDYEEPMRSDILDLLFKPNYGAAMHMIKVSERPKSVQNTYPNWCRGDLNSATENATHMQRI